MVYALLGMSDEDRKNIPRLAPRAGGNSRQQVDGWLEDAGFGGKKLASFEDPSGRLTVSAFYHRPYQKEIADEFYQHPSSVEFVITQHDYVAQAS